MAGQRYGAGIGGDYAGSVVCQPGTLNIKGGTVNATSDFSGAGIGGGWGSAVGAA